MFLIAETVKNCFVEFRCQNYWDAHMDKGRGNISLWVSCRGALEQRLWLHLKKCFQQIATYAITRVIL